MTRPIERIPAIIRIIEKAWLENPDWRFWQLLSNMGWVQFHEEDISFIERFWKFYNVDTLYWGTRWVDWKSPLTYILLSEMETSHIENILITEQHISEEVRHRLSDELIKRKREERGIKTKTKEEMDKEEYERYSKFVLDVISSQP